MECVTTDESLHMDTSIIEAPPFHGQFTLSERDQNPYKPQLCDTDTSTIWRVLSIPFSVHVKEVWLYSKEGITWNHHSLYLSCVSVHQL